MAHPLVTDLIPCLDDIKRGVAHDGAGAREPSEEANDPLGDALLGVALAVPVLHRLHDEEPDGLVAALLQDGGGHTCPEEIITLKQDLF